MVTKKFMGRGKLVKRLTAQVGDAGLAHALLIKRGDMKPSGELTAKGKKRDSMTAKERAIDRSSKGTKHSAKDYTYNPSTNRATLKRKK